MLFHDNRCGNGFIGKGSCYTTWRIHPAVIRFSKNLFYSQTQASEKSVTAKTMQYVLAMDMPAKKSVSASPVAMERCVCSC